VQDLKDIVKELLEEFFVATKRRPEQLIFYRDGVSEGQFETVQRLEIPQACAGFRGCKCLHTAKSLAAVRTVALLRATPLGLCERYCLSATLAVVVPRRR